MKGLMKVFSGGLAMWREWRMIGLIRVFIFESVLVGSHSVGRPRKMWIDTMKYCLRKRGLNVTQAKRERN